MTVKFDTGKTNYYFVFSFKLIDIIDYYIYIPKNLSKEDAIEMVLEVLANFQSIKNKQKEKQELNKALALLCYVLSDCCDIDLQYPYSCLLKMKSTELICKVREFGIKKYGEDDINTGKPLEVYRWISAAFRHIKAYLLGEENDTESGLPHLAHAGLNILLLLYQHYK